MKKRNQAWSDKTETRETKLERRAKMVLKRKSIEVQLANEDSEDSDNEVRQDWKDVVLQNEQHKS